MNDGALFLAVFLACVVEAVEATTIVLAAGTARNWRSALTGVGAGIMVLAVAMGVAVRAPVARTPENTLKFIGGVMRTSFGVFWGAEGAGAVWPGADTGFLGLAPAIAVFALAITWIMRAWRSSRGKRGGDTAPVT